MSKGKVLWVGDSPAVCSIDGKSFATTGFGKVTEETLGRLLGLDWDVSCLGVNHTGDPHDKPYDIYTAMSGGDMLGLYRLCQVIERVEPDVVVLFNDPWVIERYYSVMSRLAQVPPTVAYFPIDAEGYTHRHTAWATRAVQAKDAVFRAATYTEWGAKVFQKGGYPALIDVIPHGVNTEVFYPIDKAEARQRLGLDNPDAFIVLNPNRNSERKRIDMSIRAFAHFCKEAGVKSGQEAQLWCHMAAHEPQGYDVAYLMDRYCKEEGVENPEESRLLRLTAPGFSNYNAISPEAVNLLYNAADVLINTSVAEGYGLPAFEAAACGTPTILGYHSAHREIWGHDTAYNVYTDGSETTTGIHLDHAVMDSFHFTVELKRAYADKGHRHDKGWAAQKMVTQSRYNWDTITSQWDTLLERMVGEP